MPVRYWRTRTLGLLALVSTSAAGVQVDYTLGVGIEHNDNVNLSETDPVGDNILEPTLAFSARQQGSTVQAAADGIFEYRDFLAGRYSNDFLSQLVGQLNWSAIPERLDFTVADYLGVQPVDKFAPDTPSNQQQTNVFAFGPTLGFHLGPTIRGQAELRYVNSYAEETDQFNSQRFSAALRAIKDLSAISTLSANVVDERIDFTKSGVGPNYSRPSVYGRYTRTWSSVDMGVDIGYAGLNYSGSSIENRSSPLARMHLVWRPSNVSSFSTDLSRQYSDAASGMMLAQVENTPIPTNIATGDATATSDAYLERRAALGYAFQGVRAAFTVSPYYRKLDYVNIAHFNQRGYGGSATFSWLLRPLFRVGGGVSRDDLRYTDIDRDDKSWSVNAFLRDQWSQHWSWKLSLIHYRRDSTAPGLSSTQNIVFLGITYAR